MKGIAISFGIKNNVYGDYTSRIIHYGNFATTRASKLQLQTHNANQDVWNIGMLIDETGRVGIGTTVPNATLDVNGSFKLNRPGNLVDAYNTIGGEFILTPNPYSTANNGYLKIGYPDNSTIRFGTDYDGHIGTGVWKKIQFGRYSTPYLTIFDGGKVGIGVSGISDDALLTVNGIIHASEVKIDLTGYLADYVFYPDYELMPLHKVEQFVKTNRHLPEIPSAAEVKENGLNMGEMQNKLLQKIEELTLYMIDLQKVIDLQNARIQILESKVKQ